ncbi:MAG: hypothetical protein AB8G18_19300 [Gammaproteobacteria bacterium]
MTTKIIVTNKKRLVSKYGRKGFKQIQLKLDELIRADKARGVTTELVTMDITASVRAHSLPKVNDPDDPEETKLCIDAIFKKLEPDYLLILGAPDVVAYQYLDNPILNDDLDVPTDLPYACDAPFSEDIADFIGPTRVVGRLPDVFGETEPAALLSGLDMAINWKRRTTRSYKSCYALTAQTWEKSTALSLQRIMKKKQKQFVSPADSPPWSKKDFKPRLHFINCHGQDFDTAFYGEDASGYCPEAVDQSDYTQPLTDGTVIAAECCYGAELYDAPFAEIPPSISNTALESGVYGYLGSTNVAYGPADTNGYADLMCQYFMRNVLDGASTGRSLLEARQKYCAGEAPLDPVDLKTLAQFNLLGDPSVHPVNMKKKRSARTMAPKSLVGTKSRRKRLRRRGSLLGSTLAHVRAKVKAKLNKKMKAALLEAISSERYVQTGKIQSFLVQAAKRPSMAKSMMAKSKARGGGSYHVFGANDVKRQKLQSKNSSPKASTKNLGPDVLFIAREDGSNISSIKKVFRK